MQHIPQQCSGVSSRGIIKGGLLLIKIVDNHFGCDDLPLLEFLAEENPKIKFFWLNKKSKEVLGKNIFAVTSLSEMNL